ncbi:proton pump complex quinol oxidase subunit SoxB [Sulfurisphaera tokodaii]|uniref:Quinol oxidase subunit I n=1 Tax=Sulfurisphaera tokodaii (strain DSM 16993 / JCM 10545 / NBRC 100140 / 7) TaxID=273063 RepID=Q96XX2_SULTO|nr:proton pump complex quinol oxidase subunit SoxB [Sulfurisphaera tokodaii]BAB67505.1 putative quinol oxidase subunit I [Sulfurisphaera tokodaii str. 7]
MVKLYPKTSLGMALVYISGAISWLIVMGIAALWFRTILLNPHTNPAVGYAISPLYYFLVTLHGMSAMYIIVEDLALGIFAYALYKSGMSVVHFRTLTALFWVLNLAPIVTFAGGPITGWYMYPPLALQTQSWLNYHTDALIGMAYFFLFINSVAAILASLFMFIDAIKTRPKEGKIPIFASYAMMFAGALIFLTEPALAAGELWYTLYFWANVPVNPLTWVVLFWFFGHPVVYYVPFTVFGGLYALIPHYAGRPLYSERWARWNIILLFTFSMLAWVHHLQTFPLPVYIRAFITPTTLILAAGSGLTVLNLALTIFYSPTGYNYKDPVGFAALIAYIGFILAGLQALILPINITNVIVHNTYYVVGHFHLMIWTIIIVGSVAIILDMLRNQVGAKLDFSSLGRGFLFAGLSMWTVGALLTGYTMSYAGYLGLIRRWDAYPIKFLPFMDVMTYGAMIMGLSFVFIALPIVLTMIRVGIPIFWTPTTGVTASPGITMNTQPPSSGTPSITKEVSTSDMNNKVTKLK